MALYEATVTTAEDREAVFDYLADFRSAAEWDPSVQEASLRKGEPGHPGAEFRVVSRFMGRDVALTYRTIEVERPRRLLLVAETSTVTSRDEITLTEVAAGGTAVTYSADLRLRGPLRLFDPLLGVFFARLGDNARREMAARLARPLARERSEAPA
jgi:uncharacterized protein YndB with AHSA1/START domain